MRWITGRTLAIVNVLKIEFNGLGLNILDDKAAYMKKYKDAFTFTAQHYRPREQGLSSAGVFAAFVSGQGKA